MMVEVEIMNSRVQTQHNACGSLWYRWDLHVHTPSSFDYENKNITNEQIVSRFSKEMIRVVAITDHHTMNIQAIKELQRLGAEKLTVLPGIELRDDHGSKPIHYTCIFPEDCNLEHVWTTLQGGLGLTAASIRNKGGDQRVYVPIKEGAETARKLGGVIAIHAGAKSNSIDEIENREQFQQRIKYDITSKWVDLMEIGQIKDIDIHLNIIFPQTGLDKPLIICSDNHNMNDYQIKSALWLRADPTFRGLLMMLREPRDRVFIGGRPPELVRVEQNPTKYVRSISFQRKSEAPVSEQWFNDTIHFNPGLVAIVGNKGSGKSALADSLGLLGSTKNENRFSFLNKERFLHPKSGLATHFEATIEWVSGEAYTKCLGDRIKPEEIERLKYLPQDHVERICNEIVGIGEEGFEQELKSVIFSHVPEVLRLGHLKLDGLIQFQTGEKQKRIDFLLKQLREISRSRATLEAQGDPAVRRELLEKIKGRELELEAHHRAKPVEKPNPSAAAEELSPEETTLLRNSEVAEENKKILTEKIENASGMLQDLERRLAVANRLIEQLSNFQKEFDAFKQSLSENATELGITADELAVLSIRWTVAEKIRDEAMRSISMVKKKLDDLDPPGLRKRLADIDKTIVDLQLKLDAPNRAYQAYLKELAEWQEKGTKLGGSPKEPESLKGLQSALAALDNVPIKIEELKGEQVKIALQIHEQKLAQISVYRTLYGPVQEFIDSHELAKGKLKLEFRAELINEDFASRLLDILALNRRGSFMGIDEGRRRVEEFTQIVKWEDIESVKSFLDKVDSALHADLREKPPQTTQLKDQMLKGRKPEEVFNILYGLEYIRPKFILQWDGKDLAILSPGERGTVLLVFYLLIDKGDMPLIIDQPEGNLDNLTVAKVLVDCIKAARKKRQVFIVTHNPNLAVVCDADQVIYASMDKANGNTITYTCGALENPMMTEYITDVLEGTRWAFGVRGSKYDVGNEV